ncbi:unnamed protein product [Phyllotreta striolata]|uniref:EF-hand domain-containing protein n=1 Tax=Phyllotreta striolata TaxID=444603 RepID=A0A9N9XVL1_PHYSR|nr:unnamed protein product [Phyllotreta striolata]
MSRYDVTLNSMEETRFIALHQAMAVAFSKQYRFSYEEVISLLLMYYKMQKFENYDPKGITRDQFMELCHCALDLTNIDSLTRIVACLDDKTRDLYISKEFFIKAMSLLLRGTMEEKMAFCFKVYDAAQAGVLAKENVFKLLRTAIKSASGESDAEEMAKDMVEVVLKKLDLDRDGKISFNDYRFNVLKQPLLLEFLGQCFPTKHTVHKFMATFTENTRIRNYRSKGISIM